MTNLVSDIAYQALDAAGIAVIMGDIEDGSEQANVMLRAYRQALQQLLRAAHWDFARFTAPLVLLADATGSTPNVGTQVPGGQFLYEYQYPIDCMKVRFIPWNYFQAPPVPGGNIQPPQPTLPLMSGLGQQPAIRQPIRPARFVLATDSNYPPPGGAITWEVQGVSPQGRTVILTNVLNAQCTYTRLMLYPSNWDALFREALVVYLASQVCLSLHKDKKIAMALRPALIASAKEKIVQARIANGNEGVPSNDFTASWMRARHTGALAGSGWGSDGGGPGVTWGGYDDLGFGEGGGVY